MGTVPLVEKIIDVRNLATLFTFTVLIALMWIALNTENHQKSVIIIIVSKILQNIRDSDDSTMFESNAAHSCRFSRAFIYFEFN